MSIQTVVVVGHSFVSGLRHHLSNTTPDTPIHMAEQINISKHVKYLHLLGTPGLKLNTIKHQTQMAVSISTKQPQLVIIDAGTNDLAGGDDPLITAVHLVDFAKHVIETYNVKHVILCSALHRNNHIHTTPVEFDNIVHTFNTALKDLAEPEKDITYHTHRGFWACPCEQWSRDGIHPNTLLGRQKYKTSLRLAIFKSLKHFT